MSVELIINTTASGFNQMKENGTLEWIMSKVDQFPIKLSFIFACAMVIGSVVPYVPQYFTIKQTQNTEGFSLYVCLTLLVANILRIMFWFGKHFEIALLVQSIVMILAMFILLELCVRVRNSNLIIQQKKCYFSDSKVSEESSFKKDRLTQLMKDSPNLKRSRSLDDCHNKNNEYPLTKKSNEIKTYSNTFPILARYHQQINNNNNTTIIEMTNEKISQRPISLYSNNLSRPHSTTTKLSSEVGIPQVEIVKRSTANRTQSSSSSSAIEQSSNINKKSSIERCIISLVPKQTIVSSPGGNYATVELEDNFKKPTNVSLSIESQKILDVIGSNEIGEKSNESLNDSVKKWQNDDDDDLPKMAANVVQNNNDDNELRRKRFIDFDLRYFWEWSDFMSYLECMAVFTIFAGLVFYFFIEVPLIVEGYGLVALVTESLLASPQFFRNLKVKSTEGMSKLMVFTWFLGDFYKTIYFFIRQAPFQFLICGCTQITFDVLIFLQVIFYKKASYRKLSKSRFKHLESRARKRFKDNIRRKKMLDLLTNTSNRSTSIVTTSIYHPQPLSKITSDSLEPISPIGHQSPNQSELRSIDREKLDLIELEGYENKGATFDGQHGKVIDFRNTDEDFKEINIDEEY